MIFEDEEEIDWYQVAVEILIAEEISDILIEESANV